MRAKKRIQIIMQIKESYIVHKDLYRVNSPSFPCIIIYLKNYKYFFHDIIFNLNT